MILQRIPTDRVERWKLLNQFIEVWYGRVDDAPVVSATQLDAAEQRLHLKLPVALREWYELSAARKDVWSTQDRLLLPERLRVEGDVLVFYLENQAVVQWGIRVADLTLEDPPVLVSDQAGSGDWFVENHTLSEFALQFAAANAKWSEAVRFRGNGQLSDDALRAIDSSYARLPFPNVRWPAWPSRLYGAEDALLETHGDTWVWVTCLTADAFRGVRGLLETRGLTWEHLEPEDG